MAPFTPPWTASLYLNCLRLTPTAFAQGNPFVVAELAGVVLTLRWDLCIIRYKARRYAPAKCASEITGKGKFELHTVLDENTPKGQLPLHIRPRTGWVAGLTHGAHDASSVLCHEGSLVVWVEQERISRRKHAVEESPAESLAKCLDFAGIKLDDLDCIALGSDHARLARWLGLSRSDRHKVMSYDLPSRLFPPHLQGDTSRLPEVIAVSHHLSHAASAFYPSGFDRAAALVIDAMGEDTSTTLAKCEGKTIEFLESYGVEDSLGFFYEAALEYVGFTKFEAGKFMGLAAYGSPVLQIPLNGDASQSSHLWTLDGGPCDIGRAGIRARNQLLLRHFTEECFPYTIGLHEDVMAYKDFAATVQTALEKSIQLLAQRALALSSCDRLVMAGGVALNCAANGTLAASGLLKDLFVQPAAHDSGVALGAALETSARLYGNAFRPTVMRHAYWGTSNSRDEVISALEEAGLHYEQLEPDSLCHAVAEILVNQGIVAWHQGRAEIGPRALGARSLLADPQYRKNLVRVNAIKGREVWRPLAPSVLEDSFQEYFEGCRNPFMVVATQVRASVQRSIPAVVHVDGSARPQVVNHSSNPRYAALLDAFRCLTGIPILINTSLNEKHEPICNSARDTVRFFLRSGADALAIEDFLVRHDYR